MEIEFAGDKGGLDSQFESPRAAQPVVVAPPDLTAYLFLTPISKPYAKFARRFFFEPYLNGDDLVTRRRLWFNDNLTE